MLPPESLTRPSGDPPAAMIAASPLLLTPGERLMSYVLVVPLCRGLQRFSPWIGDRENHSVQAGVHGVDVLQMRSHHLNRGKLLGPDRARDPTGRRSDHVPHRRGA